MLSYVNTSQISVLQPALTATQLPCRHGMTPMITLHHFVHPQWFEDLGAFTTMDNVKHFVSFCQVAFRWGGLLGMSVAQMLQHAASTA